MSMNRLRLLAMAVLVSVGLYAADEGDQTIGTSSMTISKSRKVPIRWNGEEQKSGINSGWYATLLL